MLGTQFVHHMLLLEGLAQQVQMLGLVRFVKFFPGVELGDVAGFKADDFIAVVQHTAVIEQHFQRRGKVHIHAAGGVGIAVGHARFGAA